MLKGIETIVYYVDDIKRASRWYREVLGIEPNYDTEYYVGFTVAGDELGLHPTGEEPRKSGTEGQTGYWSVQDIHKAVAHFVGHGATLFREISEVGGGIFVASVLDPFGNAIGLIQNPHSPNR